MRLPLRLLGKAETVVAFAVLLGLVVALQVAGGAYASGFGGLTSFLSRSSLSTIVFRLSSNVRITIV